MTNLSSDDDRKMKRRSTRGVSRLLKNNDNEEEKEEEGKARRRSTRRMSARFMQTRRTSEIIRSSRRTSVMLKKNFWKDEVQRNGKLELFELHCALLSTNTLLPPDVITSFFENVKDKDGFVSMEKLDKLRTNLCWYYESFDDSPETGIHKQIVLWKAMVIDVEFWIILIYTLAGILLIVTTFPIGSSLPDNVTLNMSLLASTCYAICSSRSVFTFPFRKWTVQKKTIEISKSFKEKIKLSAAKRYTYDNRPLETEGDKYGHLMMYIKESTMLNDKVTERLGKRDLDLLLLKELRQIISPEIFGNIWKSMKKDNRSTFEGSELHSYIMREDDESNKVHILSIAKKTLSNVSWWMSLSFLSGSVLSFTKKILPLANKELDYVFGTIPTPIMINFLFLVGTLVFTMSTYERKKLSFEMKEKARTILETFADAPQENENEFVINEKKTKLDKTKLNTYLTRRSIALPEKDINLLFDNMDSEKAGVVGKNDIEEYVQKYLVRFKFLSILLLCLKSFEFWSNLVWFFGSLAYIIAAYFPDGNLGKILNEIGALGYFFGGLVLLNCLHIKKNFSVSTKYMFYKALCKFLGPRQSLTTSTYTDLTPGSLEIDSHVKKERQVSLGNCIFTLDEDDFSSTDDEPNNTTKKKKQKFVTVGGYTFPISDSESSSDDDNGDGDIETGNLQSTENNKVEPQNRNMNFDNSYRMSSRTSIGSSEKTDDEFADDESTSTFVTSNLKKRRESMVLRRGSQIGSFTSQTISEDSIEDESDENDTMKSQRTVSASGERGSQALRSNIAGQIISEHDVNENGDFGQHEDGNKMDNQASRRCSASSRRGSASSRRGSTSSRRGSTSSRRGSTSSRRGSTSSRRGSQTLRSSVAIQTISKILNEYDDSSSQKDVLKLDAVSTTTGSSLSRRGSASSRRSSTSSRRGSQAMRSSVAIQTISKILNEYDDSSSQKDDVRLDTVSTTTGSSLSGRGSASSRRSSTSSRRGSQALRSSIASQTISEIDIEEFEDFDYDSKEDIKESELKRKKRRMSFLPATSAGDNKMVDANIEIFDIQMEQKTRSSTSRNGSSSRSVSPYSSSGSRRSSDVFRSSLASQTISEDSLEDFFDDKSEKNVNDAEKLSLQEEKAENDEIKNDDSKNCHSRFSSDAVITHEKIISNQESRDVASSNTESNVPQNILVDKQISDNNLVEKDKCNVDVKETSGEQIIILDSFGISGEDSQVSKDSEKEEKILTETDEVNEKEDKALDIV